MIVVQNLGLYEKIKKNSSLLMISKQSKLNKDMYQSMRELVVIGGQTADALFHDSLVFYLVKYCLVCRNQSIL